MRYILRERSNPLEWRIMQIVCAGMMRWAAVLSPTRSETHIDVLACIWAKGRLKIGSSSSSSQRGEHELRMNLSKARNDLSRLSKLTVRIEDSGCRSTKQHLAVEGRGGSRVRRQVRLQMFSSVWAEMMSCISSRYLLEG
jgi:hypothetical protein